MRCTPWLRRLIMCWVWPQHRLVAPSYATSVHKVHHGLVRHRYTLYVTAAVDHHRTPSSLSAAKKLVYYHTTSRPAVPTIFWFQLIEFWILFLQWFAIDDAHVCCPSYSGAEVVYCCSEPCLGTWLTTQQRLLVHCGRPLTHTTLTQGQTKLLPLPDSDNTQPTRTTPTTACCIW